MNQDHFISDRLVHLVEMTGIEVPVTLLVSGTPIVGTLCPAQRYIDWYAELIRRASFGAFSARGSMPPPTPIQVEAIQARWADMPEEERPLSFSFFALRNATIQASMWRQAPYLLVSSAHVGAMHVGITDAP